MPRYSPPWTPAVSSTCRQSTRPIRWPAIAAVWQPVLIVQGGRDESVRPDHAEHLRAARGDLPTATLVVPDVQHMYKTIPEGVSGPAVFGLEGPTDERVTRGIDDWIRT